MISKQYFQNSDLYREVRYAYRSLVHYHKLFSYLYYRFVVGPEVRVLKSPIRAREVSLDISIHFLSGHRDLDMLLNSLVSWYGVNGKIGKVYIHEDGSFSSDDREFLRAIFPEVTIVKREQISQQVLSALQEKFPAAYKFRKLSEEDSRYVFNLKLIDPLFVGEAKVRLILDSDLIWFKKPDELIGALEGGKLPIFMGGFGDMDFVFSDGTTLSKEISGINSGVVGYEKSKFSLEKLEEFYSRVGENTNPHFIEQAGYAYILTRDTKPNFLPSDRYIIKGPMNSSSVMKHYTSPRREQLWFEGVRELSKTNKLFPKVTFWKNELTSQVLRYLVSGVTAVAANVLVFYLLLQYAALKYFFAAAGAFVISFFTSFFLQKFWTFREQSRDLMLRQIWEFFWVAMLDLAINLATLWVLIDGLMLPEVLSQVISLGFIAGCNFILFRLIVFRKGH